MESIDSNREAIPRKAMCIQGLQWITVASAKTISSERLDPLTETPILPLMSVSLFIGIGNSV